MASRDNSAPIWQDLLQRTIQESLARIDIPGQDEREDPELKWYREHCYIRSVDERLLPLELRAAQKEFHVDFTGRDIVDKARKLGISTYVAARFYRAVTTKRNIAAAMVAHKPDSVQELWKIVKLLKDNDPRQPRTKYDSRKELYFPEFNSYFVVLGSGKGTGRAATFNRLHISELAHFTDDAQETLAGLISAVPPRHTGSEIVIESTANGEGNEFHRRWLQAVLGLSDFMPHFFPWWRHPDYTRPWQRKWEKSDEEKKWKARVQAEFGVELTDDQFAFIRDRISDIGINMTRQEFPYDWRESFLASGRKVFEGETLQALERALVQKPVRLEKWGQSYLAIYKAPKAGRRYVAGADTSEGVEGGDNQDIRVLDADTLEEVAALRGHWPIYVFARKIAELCRMFRVEKLVVERNNHGHAVLGHLVHSEDPKIRLPHDVIYYHQDYDQKLKRMTRKPGWPTNRKTKPVMIHELEELIRKHVVKIHDQMFYVEARAYEHKDHAGMGAPEGMHDDSVMAVALALQARLALEGKVGYSGKRLRLGI